MHAPRTVFLLALTFVFLVACQQEKPAPNKAANAPRASEAYFRFVEIRVTPPIDFARLAALFDEALVAHVREVDARYNTQLAPRAARALADAQAGHDLAANAQLAEKSIQRSFILDFLNALPSSDPARRALAQDAAPVVRGIAERRDNTLGEQRALTEAFDAAWAQVQSGGDVAPILALTDKLLVLSVFHELTGLAAARGADPAEAAAKRAEASVYYESLEPAHARRDAAAARSVTAELARPPEQIDVALVRQLLSHDFADEIAGIDPARLGLVTP